MAKNMNTAKGRMIPSATCLGGMMNSAGGYAAWKAPQRQIWRSKHKGREVVSGPMVNWGKPVVLFRTEPMINFNLFYAFSIVQVFAFMALINMVCTELVVTEVDENGKKAQVPASKFMKTLLSISGVTVSFLLAYAPNRYMRNKVEFLISNQRETHIYIKTMNGWGKNRYIIPLKCVTNVSEKLPLSSGTRAVQMIIAGIKQKFSLVSTGNFSSPEKWNYLFFGTK